MNEPFAFLDEEEPVNEKPGISWLPLSLTGIALSGFLVVPILGLLEPENQSSDWAQYADTAEGMEVSLLPEDGPVTGNLEPLLTPDPNDLTADLTSVDEMLASLGDNYVPPAEIADVPSKTKRLRGITVKASKEIAGRKKSGKTEKRDNLISLKPTIGTKAKRLPAVQKPGVAALAGQAALPTHGVEVRPGDTLYSISRRAGVPPEEIARINGIRPGDPIKPGQKLKIPGSLKGGEQPALPAPLQYSALPNQPRAVRPASAGPIGAVRNPLSEPDGPGDAPKIIRPATMPTQPGIASPHRLDGPNMGYGDSSQVDPGLFPGDPAAMPKSNNPLDAYNNAVAYRVQRFDNLNTISDALATTPEELIKLNGRSKFKKGEMLVVPVDNCMVKDN